MTHNEYGRIPCEIKLDDTGLNIVPTAIREHVKDDGKLYLIEEPRRGAAFISTAKNPVGQICTYVGESHLIVQER